jgi:hypothetical protein
MQINGSVKTTEETCTCLNGDTTEHAQEILVTFCIKESATMSISTCSHNSVICLDYYTYLLCVNVFVLFIVLPFQHCIVGDGSHKGLNFREETGSILGGDTVLNYLFL